MFFILLFTFFCVIVVLILPTRTQYTKDISLLLFFINAFVYLFIPGIIEINNRNLFPNVEYSLLTYTSVVFFLLFFLLGIFRTEKDLKPIDKRLSFSHYSFKGVIIISCVYLVGISVFAYQFLPVFLKDPGNYIASRISLLKGNGYLLSIAGLGSPLFFIFFYYAKFTKKRKFYIALGVLFALNAFVALLKGSRTSLLEPLLMILMAEVFFSPKIRIGRYIKYGVIILIFVNVLSVLGKVRSNRNIDSVESSTITENIITQFSNSFSFVEFLNFVIAKDAEFLYGQSYAAVISLPVPRSVWQEKPLGAGPYLKNIVAPGSYDLMNNEYNSSLTTGVLLESYLNFGLWGVVLIGFLYGRISAILNRSLFFNKNSPRKDVIVFFFIYMLFTAISFGEFYGAFTRIAIFIIPFYFFGKQNINRVG